MKQDILGQNELNQLKLNWNFAAPGLNSTRCCGTGTCDAPHPDPLSLRNDRKKHMILFNSNNKDLEIIKKNYGYLRT